MDHNTESRLASWALQSQISLVEALLVQEQTLKGQRLPLEVFHDRVVLILMSCSARAWNVVRQMAGCVTRRQRNTGSVSTMRRCRTAVGRRTKRQIVRSVGRRGVLHLIRPSGILSLKLVLRAMDVFSILCMLKMLIIRVIHNTESRLASWALQSHISFVGALVVQDQALEGHHARCAALNGSTKPRVRR